MYAGDSGNTLYEAWRADAAAVGCDRILLLRGTEEADFQFAAAAVAQAVKAQKPEIVIFPATPDGRDLAPKVAVRLQTGLTADCTQLAIGEQGSYCKSADVWRKRDGNDSNAGAAAADGVGTTWRHGNSQRDAEHTGD